MFTKEERSSFSYWFAHWCAFNMTALNLKIWKIKYLFHDIEKPWLLLLLRKNYSKVQKFHRLNNRHHLEYNGKKEHDYEAMIIDWESSKLTKASCNRNAREETQHLILKYPQYKEMLENKIIPILNKLQI